MPLSKSNPRVTIITPSYNQGQFLEETILSILNQGYPNLEYMVIDGGSKDQSVDIIRKYESRLSYWESEKDKGQSDAINKGLRRATGDIITWINSDDLLEPGAIQAMVEAFDENTGLVYGRNRAFGSGNIQGVNSYRPGNDLMARYLGRIEFPQPASFFSAKVIRETGLCDQSLHYGMDYDLFARIALNYHIKKIDHVISGYRFHDASKSVSQAFKFAEDWARVFSRVLRSMETGVKHIPLLKSLGLYHEDGQVYTVKMPVTENDLEGALLYFLQEQAQCYYGDLRMKRARDIARAVKAINPQFYKEHRLDQLHLRSRLLSPAIVRLVRKFKS